MEIIEEGEQRTFSVEEDLNSTKLLRFRDGWRVRPSEVFGEEGFFEIDKRRKRGEGDRITVHVNPKTLRVRKFAGEAVNNPKIEKEARMWKVALVVFGIPDQIHLGAVRMPRLNPKKGNVDVAYLDMPYMGVPLGYFRKVRPDENLSGAFGNFTQKMIEMVVKHGIFLHDLNEGNILVRIVDGKVVLFPIDWESARTRGVAKNPEYYVKVTKKRLIPLYY